MSKRKVMHVPVTKRALIQRINRVLVKQGEALRTTRGRRWWSNLGDHYTVDVDRNWIVATHVDLEGYGHELGVLQGYERVEE